MSLPPIHSLQDLADFLGVKRGQLAYYAYYIEPDQAYTGFSIIKRSGKERHIDAPVKGLKDLQRIIYEKFSGEVNFRKCVYAYVKDRGILQNSAIHLQQRWVLRVDLRDFFPTVTTARVAGMFRAPPFGMAEKPARALALICTKNGRLTQGSPISPWITNVICRGLDYNLQKIASKCKCYYSRYADDLFFSTSNRLFPATLAHISDGESNITIGDELKLAIIGAGFSPNEEKTSLKASSQRQIVTGIVVNSRPNIPKQYIKNVRAALYSWEKFGLSGAEVHWQRNVDNRNRWGGSFPRFRWVVRGQINFIRYVRGEADPVYLKLATRLKKLDDSFSFDPKISAQSVILELNLFVEGVTDRKHIEKALSYAQKNNMYLDLNIVFPNQRDFGSSNLQKLCATLSAIHQRCLTICIFDRDEKDYIKTMGGSSGDYLDHNNNVYSLILPIPGFRTESDICIEHLYEDKDLYLKDSNGRRLYAKSEFDKHSCHVDEPNIFLKLPTKSLICDSNVIDISTKTSVALSKNDFASHIYDEIAPFDKVSFDGFLPLFDKLQEIKNLFIK